MGQGTCHAPPASGKAGLRLWDYDGGQFGSEACGLGRGLTWCDVTWNIDRPRFYPQSSNWSFVGGGDLHCLCFILFLCIGGPALLLLLLPPLPHLSHLPQLPLELSPCHLTPSSTRLVHLLPQSHLHPPALSHLWPPGLT